MNDEPKNSDMEDYDDKESPQKRRIIWLVVVICLLVGLALSQFERDNSKEFILKTAPSGEAKK